MSGFVAGAIVVGAAVGAYGSYRAGKEAKAGAEAAAREQAKAAEQAAAEQKSIREVYEPYIVRSLQGYEELLKKPESVKETPGYLFRLQQGLEALGVPTGGRQLSGAQIRRSLEYGQKYATAEYQNALARVAGLGSLATGTYAASTSGQEAISRLQLQAAQARAEGIYGAAQARAASTLGISRAISQGFNQYAMYRGYYQNQAPASYYGAGQYSGYGGNVAGDAYAPAYGGY